MSCICEAVLHVQLLLELLELPAAVMAAARPGAVCHRSGSCHFLLEIDSSSLDWREGNAGVCVRLQLFAMTGAAAAAGCLQSVTAG